jgi:death on curing protein
LANEPRWLTPEEITYLNQAVVELTDEPFLLHDAALLESTCARPEQYWHYEEILDVVELSIILLLGIARNHPFIQGNKRTAFAASLAFLKANGWELLDSDDDAFADIIIGVIVGDIPDGLLLTVWRSIAFRSEA